MSPRTACWPEIATSARRLVAVTTALALATTAWPGASFAQQTDPTQQQVDPAQQPTDPAQQPDAQQAPSLSIQQIDQLVAPIALYPDNLLGQVLTASTYPLEIVMAARWSTANPNVKGQQLEDVMQQQTWDPSVKALTAVPQVLQMMSEKLEWTQQLGDAYLAQPDDIATSVQRLRARADASGNLKSSEQIKVRREPAPAQGVVGVAPPPEYIVIEPAEPEVLYVPVYDPWVVYGAWPYPAYRPFYWYPPGYVAAGVFGFAAAVVVGSALWAHYNWRSRRVDVNIVRYNHFNRAHLANTAVNQSWRHNPNHRGNLAYGNPALQQRFGKGSVGPTSTRQGPGQQFGTTNKQFGTTNKPGTGNYPSNAKLFSNTNSRNTGNTTFKKNTGTQSVNVNPTTTKNVNVNNVNKNVTVNKNTNVNVNRNTNLNKGPTVNRSFNVNKGAQQQSFKQNFAPKPNFAPKANAAPKHYQQKKGP